MKKLISYVLAFVLGFGACALILNRMGYVPNPGKESVIRALTKRPVPPTTGKGQSAIADAVERIGPAVVNIHTEAEREVRNPFENFSFGVPRSTQVLKGAGSGVIISKDGYILTNNHVVAGVRDINVRLTDGRSFKARVIDRDPLTDLAVVKVNANNLPVAELGDSDAVRAGDWAIAIGNPFALGTTVTVGVISATKRTEMVERGKVLQDLIQTDAAINLGNSGGALANIDGQVVGINTAIYSTEPGRGNIGIGFAIPINSAKVVAKHLIEKGKIPRPSRPYLGVGVVDLSGDLSIWYEQNGFKAGKGAVIWEVQPDSPAAKAGLRQRDVMTDINAQKITSAEDVTKAIQKCKVNQVVRITIWRTGKIQLLAAKLIEMPADL